MEAVAAATPTLSGERLARFDAAVSRIADPGAFDVAQARAVAEEMLAVTV
jgi:hypothetical protein